MGFVESIKTCFSKCFVFSGRASRSEFWWFGLFVILLYIPAIYLDILHFGSFDQWARGENYGPFGLFLYLSSFIPILAVTFRRLHDVNKSVWWIIIMHSLIFTHDAFEIFEEKVNLLKEHSQIIIDILLITPALIISLLILFWLIKKSNKSSNKYGANPNKK